MIKHKRKEKRLSQIKLAEKIGVSRGYISRLERRDGEFHPSIEKILLLSRELELCPIKVFTFFVDIKCYKIEED